MDKKRKDIAEVLRKLFNVKEMLRPWYRLLIYLLRKLQVRVSPRTACLLQNIFSLLTFSPSRYFYNEKTKLYLVQELEVKRYFHEMVRGFSFYGRGINRRGKNLFNSYLLNQISFNKDDVVIDCGANYADLFLSLDKKIKARNYITFEPGPFEYNCVSKNVPNSRNEKLGLANIDGTKKFYLCSASGDSSFIMPKLYTETIMANVITLDSYIKKNNITACKLLKLEAEGYELEILKGANEFLKICKYVAIDGNAERGKSDIPTFPMIANELYSAGFKMIGIGGISNRALFVKI